MRETRVVNAKTGGEKGEKDVKLSLIPPAELEEVARLYAYGARKYAKHNWSKGYEWSLSYDALGRHLLAFWQGESTHLVIPNEEGTRAHHLASVVFHALALMYFERNHPDLDDRPGALSSKPIDDRPMPPVVPQDVPEYLRQLEEMRTE